MMSDIPVILKDLPVKIHGFVCLGSDYEPIIVINARLSKVQQLRTYRHEIRHIQRGEIYDMEYHEYAQ